MKRSVSEPHTLPLPLFEDKAIEPPTWLRELYVAIPKEDLERLKAWCKHQPHSGSDVVRLLVKIFLEANWDLDEADLETRLRECLNQATQNASGKKESLNGKPHQA